MRFLGEDDREGAARPPSKYTPRAPRPASGRRSPFWRLAEFYVGGVEPRADGSISNSYPARSTSMVDGGVMTVARPSPGRFPRAVALVSPLDNLVADYQPRRRVEIHECSRGQGAPFGRVQLPLVRPWDQSLAVELAVHLFG